MKAEAILRLSIDTEREGQTAMSHTPGDDRHYTINIRKRPLDMQPDDPLSTTAHELGHFIAAVFKTSKALKDPNNSPVSAAVVHDVPVESYSKDMYASEEEAWQFGEYVMEGFIKNREFSLGTYKARIIESQNANDETKALGSVLERIADLYGAVAESK